MPSENCEEELGSKKSEVSHELVFFFVVFLRFCFCLFGGVVVVYIKLSVRWWNRPYLLIGQEVIRYENKGKVKKMMVTGQNLESNKGYLRVKMFVCAKVQRSSSDDRGAGSLHIWSKIYTQARIIS